MFESDFVLGKKILRKGKFYEIVLSLFTYKIVLRFGIL